MDLTTSYLGLKLKNPIVPSAGPLTSNVDSMKQLEDAGAAAVVMHSVFEEQIELDAAALDHHLSAGAESTSESSSYFPTLKEYRTGPEEYLNLVSKAKQSLKIPVIASLNGYTSGGWTDYAMKIEQAGADALELNIYYLPTDTKVTSSKVENIYLAVVKSVIKSIKIPIAVKLSPYFSATANFAAQLDDAGVNGLVLFNRFYQPDINLLTKEPFSHLVLSTSIESRLSLRWIAILFGKIKANLAATSGIHTYDDVIKLILAGADVTMMCSALIQNGPSYINTVLKEITAWMENFDYDSIAQMKGSLSQKAVADPAAFERANYMKVLQSYK